AGPVQGLDLDHRAVLVADGDLGLEVLPRMGCDLGQVALVRPGENPPVGDVRGAVPAGPYGHPSGRATFQKRLAGDRRALSRNPVPGSLVSPVRTDRRVREDGIEGDVAVLVELGHLRSGAPADEHAVVG